MRIKVDEFGTADTEYDLTEERDDIYQWLIAQMPDAAYIDLGFDLRFQEGRNWDLISLSKEPTLPVGWFQETAKFRSSINNSTITMQRNYTDDGVAATYEDWHNIECELRRDYKDDSPTFGKDSLNAFLDSWKVNKEKAFIPSEASRGRQDWGAW